MLKINCDNCGKPLQVAIQGVTTVFDMGSDIPTSISLRLDGDVVICGGCSYRHLLRAEGDSIEVYVCKN